MSQALGERIREKATALEVAQPLAPNKPGEVPVMLEKILVLGKKETGNAPTEKITAAERFLKTGHNFETEWTHGDVTFSPTKARDVRVEIGVTNMW